MTAACAAASLVGRTSFACIDRESSTTRMIVASSRGTSVSTFGRASAPVAAASASRKRRSGTYRRQAKWRPVAAAAASTSMFVKRTA